MAQLELAPLPYAYDALQPVMSSETLHFHHDKHHAAYVKKANELLPGSGFENFGSLEDLVVKAQGKLYNQIGQIWNHDFFWQGMFPKGKALDASSTLGKAILSEFGSLEQLRDRFFQVASELFGSGWAWLAKDSSGKLNIVGTSNAENPLRQGLIPLLTCDVWEHAYYIDYRNERKKFLEGFWSVANWEFAARCFEDRSLASYANKRSAA